MDFRTHRPVGHVGKGDEYLSRVFEDLERVIAKLQQSFEHDTLRLRYKERENLAAVLAEFAEDLHNGIGIWASLERYNGEFLGTPLPFVGDNRDDLGEEPISERRTRHLLWVLFSMLNPEIILSPTHRDLKKLAEAVSGFLRARFAHIPRVSSVKTFLMQPNTYGWDVKRKLVWLGTHSYLFRDSFRSYVGAHGGKAEIPVVDDYVCQATTAWSGLGVIDILASVLDISGEQQSELRTWHERHLAYYRILPAKGQSQEVVNVISDQPYTVRVSADKNPFHGGMVVFGSLVPWNGEWYWSGTQQALPDVSEKTLQELKNAFRRKHPGVTYRYCGDLAEKARQRNEAHHHEFVSRYGSDLVIYPNGLSMAAEYQKQIRQQWESMPKETIDKAVDKFKLKGPQPDLHFPGDLLKAEGGVAVYHNPEEGMEIMTGFNSIVSGLKKKGENLSEDEGDAIRSFIRTESTSPRFVRRAIDEHGGRESINAAFLIRSNDEESLDYLLRRYKGAYYRKRYPRIALL